MILNIKLINFEILSDKMYQTCVVLKFVLELISLNSRDL